MSLAAPVTRDGFAYASGDLFAHASNHNSHRRATVSELQDHFKNGSDKDHPAHWFEAQLLHYGLAPSKTKSVARMRLFDAMNAGNLVVPAPIQKLERELKKEWAKSEREAKKALKTQNTPQPAATTSAPAKKRKADASNVDLTLNVGGVNITLSANNATKSSAATAKKPKTSSASTASSKPVAKPKAAPTTKAVKEKAAPKPKASSATAKRTKATAAKASAASSSTPSSTTTPARKQTARARRGGLSQAPGRPATTTTSSASAAQQAPRRIQTARRSGAFAALGGRVSPPSPRGYNNDYDSYDESPPPKQERYSSSPSPPPTQPLGLLNGRYNVASQYITSQWNYPSHSFSLTLTLSGRSLWGKFDLGIVEGIMYFEERPWDSSADETVRFIWRGQETDGQILYGNQNEGWMRFYGGGEIDASLDWMGIKFAATRADGQGTRSQVDVSEMRRLWDSYSEDEYERLNRSRWG
ncbi:hypothetical protein F4808DRAFT_34882 [Astrocystis sublimbata]|nr:hypothetical protein F4808DRAFT_34882 [Astrocystis sublimbata]